MWSYRDYNTGYTWQRQIEGCTLQVLLQPSDAQIATAARELHTYCSFFSVDGPIIIGRGCLNMWRPEGFGRLGTRRVEALEVYTNTLSREMWVATFCKSPNERQYIPGEVVVYGNGDLAVCLDASSREIAVPLKLYTSADPVMVDFPIWVTMNNLVYVAGCNLLTPTYALIVDLERYVQICDDVNTATNNPACTPDQRNLLEFRKRELWTDVHDWLYLCYNRAKFSGARVDVNEPRLARARQNVNTYLRSVNEVDTNAYNTETDYLVEIGLSPGRQWGPQYNLPIQTGWN
jgi:hypothetical protein